VPRIRNSRLGNPLAGSNAQVANLENPDGGGGVSFELSLFVWLLPVLLWWWWEHQGSSGLGGRIWRILRDDLETPVMVLSLQWS
jgi:hypothetical protein